MMRGVMEMLPLVNDTNKSSFEGEESGPPFELPEAEPVEVKGQGEHPLGDNQDGRETITRSSQDEQGRAVSDSDAQEDRMSASEEASTETREDVTSEDDGAAQELRGDKKEAHSGEDERHRDDTVEAADGQNDMAERLAMAREKISQTHGKKGIRLSASDMVAALTMQRRSRGNKSLQNLLTDTANAGKTGGKRKAGLGKLDLAGLERQGTKVDLNQGLKGAEVRTGDNQGRLAEDLLKADNRMGRDAMSRDAGRLGNANRAEDAQALAAMQRLSRANRARAQHLRSEISSNRALESSTNIRSKTVERPTELAETPRQETARHVSREVRKAVEKDEGLQVNRATAKAGQSVSATINMGEAGMGNMMGQQVTATAAPTPVQEAPQVDPQVSEALRNLNQTEENQTILKLNDAHAGKIEVRLRHDGRDLTVSLRAEDVGGRQKMLDALPDVRRELDKANLVAGRVDVTEFGQAGFDLHGEGRGQDREGTEEIFTEGNEQDGKKSGPTRSSASTPSSGATLNQDSGRDGRLHLVV